jgi:hypothetical protein
MTLTEIQSEIVSIHAQLSLRASTLQARRIGELLTAAKRKLRHGQFEGWLRQLKIAKTTAHDYRCVFLGWGKVRSAEHLGLTEFLQIYRRGKRAERREHRNSLARLANDPGIDPGIRCCDCLTWLRGQQTGSIPFFICDPPYGLGFQFDGWTDADNPEDYWRWLQPRWREMQRVLQPGGLVLMWQGYQHLEDGCLAQWFPGCKLLMACFTYRSNRAYTPIVKYVKPGAQPLIPDLTLNDWFCVTMGRTEDPLKHLHPSPKSLELCRQVVRRYSLPGALVVDCFMGSGTIPIACMLEGRRYLGLDQSARYCRLARLRLKKAANGQLGEVG